MVLLTFPLYVTGSAISDSHSLVEFHIGMQVEVSVLVLLLAYHCFLHWVLGREHVCYHLPGRRALTISQQQRLGIQIEFCGLYHLCRLLRLSEGILILIIG